MNPRLRLALGLVGGALLFTSLVAALAVQAEVDRSVAAGGVPMPRAGDVAVYASMDPEGWTWARWNGTRAMPDEWGIPVEAEVLELATERYVFARLSFRPGALEPFAEENAGPVDTPGVTSARVHLRTEYGEGGWTWSDANWNYACLLRAGWQGRAFAELDGAPATSVCPFLAASADVVRSSGVERVGDRDLQRMTVYNGSRPVLTVWLATDVPFPMAAARCGPSSMGSSCTYAQAQRNGIVLARHVAGAGEPLSASFVRPEEGPPADALAPLAPTGPPDGRADAWTLEEAAAAVEADPRLTRFQAWRQAHPEARVVEATYYLSQPGGALSSLEPSNAETWALTYQGADETRYAVQASPAAPACQAAPLGAGAAAYPTVAWEGESAERIDFPPRVFPDRVLSVPAALRHLEHEDGYSSSAWFTLHEEEGTTVARWYVDRQPADAEAEQEGERRVEMDALTGRILAREGIESVPVITEATLEDVGASTAASSTVPSESAPGPFRSDRTLPPGAARASAAFVAGLALLAAFAAGARLPAALVVAYSRLTRRDVLEHPRRRALLETVRARPGLSTRELEERLGFGSGAARHHLEVLVRSGDLARLEAGGFTRYFVAGSADHARLAEEAVLLSGRAEARVLERLRMRPGIHAAELARELRVSRPAVHHALRRLSRRGLVREERVAGRILLYARGATGAKPTDRADA